MSNNTNAASKTPSPRQHPIIAIDGPAGAGKSTLAAHLARRFGFLNLETGAMYRALALKAIENDIDFDEEQPLLDIAGFTRIKLEPQLEGNRVTLDGRDVSRRVRDPDVTAAASRISVHPHLRAWMVEQQRVLGAPGGVVMEGRDIGTAVFPDAEVKIFLDASPEVRGDRRYRQAVVPLRHPGEEDMELERPKAPSPEEISVRKAAHEKLVKEMKERDERDRNRAESPLRPAADAIVLDSTTMSLDQVLAKAEDIVRSHITVDKA
jgi:cytidylate kinase